MIVSHLSPILGLDPLFPVNKRHASSPCFVGFLLSLLFFYMFFLNQKVHLVSFPSFSLLIFSFHSTIQDPKPSLIHESQSSLGLPVNSYCKKLKLQDEQLKCISQRTVRWPYVTITNSSNNCKRDEESQNSRTWLPRTKFRNIIKLAHHIDFSSNWSNIIRYAKQEDDFYE